MIDVHHVIQTVNNDGTVILRIKLSKEQLQNSSMRNTWVYELEQFCQDNFDEGSWYSGYSGGLDRTEVLFYLPDTISAVLFRLSCL